MLTSHQVHTNALLVQLEPSTLYQILMLLLMEIPSVLNVLARLATV